MDGITNALNNNNNEILLLPNNYTGGNNPTFSFDTAGSTSITPPDAANGNFYSIATTALGGNTGRNLQVSFPLGFKANEIDLYWRVYCSGSNGGVFALYCNDTLIATKGRAAAAWSEPFQKITLNLRGVDPSKYLRAAFNAYLGSTLVFIPYMMVIKA